MKRPLFSIQEIQTAEDYLSSVDPVLQRLINSQKLVIPTKANDYFSDLCESIISQQVSIAAARTIFGRFKDLTNVDPKLVNKLSVEKLRTVGVSKQKAGYILDLTAHFIRNPNIYDHLDQQPDDLVMTELVEIKGIGIWTAQMFLIFTLGRPDIFAPGDAGLQRAIATHYKMSGTAPPSEYNKIALPWSPYRTVACLHLWQSLNNKP